MKKKLILDCTFDMCQVGLGDTAGNIIAKHQVSMHRGHGEQLIPMVEMFLAHENIDYDSIDHIIVTTGPGSYTGLRVGIAAARGFSIALDIPCIGVTTLEAHAAHLTHKKTNTDIAIALDARHGNVFGQIFTHDGKPIDKPRIDSLSVFSAALSQHIIIAGSAAQYVTEIASSLGRDLTIAHQNAAPNLQGILKVALTKSPDEAPLIPLYLRPPNAKSQINKSVIRV